MLTLAEFKALRAASNPQPAKFIIGRAPTAAPVPLTILMSSTARSGDAIVNAFGVNSVQFQIAREDVPVVPEKFDAIEINERRYVIDLVVEKRSRVTGEVVSFSCYSKGK